MKAATLTPLETLARVKSIPLPFLRSLDLRDLEGGGVGIPYSDEAGEELFVRSRDVPGAERFMQPRGVKLRPYGLWRLAGDVARSGGELYLVEGESDCWALWYHGLAALGFPGSSSFGVLDRSHLEGVERVYVCDEQDQGAEAFIPGLAKRLARLGYGGEAYRFTLGEVKDPSDLNGLDPSRFKDALREATARAVALDAPVEARPKAAGEPWDEPVPLGEDAEKVEPFPLTVFPPVVADFFAGAAEAIGCPVDYLGCFGLGMAAGVTGAVYACDVKAGYVEPSSLYLCVVAPPGSKKTPALKCIGGPVYEEAARRHRDKQPPPYVSDVTAEKLADLMRENPRGGLVVRDELAGWMKSMDQYKAKGSGADRQFWLACWSGEPVSVHRKDPDKPPVFVRHPTVSVVGGIQPDALARLRGGDDGFFDRILFSFPTPLPVRAEDWAEVPAAGLAAWADTLDRVMKLPMTAGESGPRPFFLHLSAGARSEWERWTGRLANELNGEDFPRHLRGPAVKLMGYAARMAVTLHALRAASGACLAEEVEPADLEGGSRLAAYFLSHARRVYLHMGRDLRIDDARRVLSWVKKQGKPSFSRRDAWRSLRRQFARPEELSSPLQLLQAHGYLRSLGHEETGHARHHTTVYEVNPRLLVTGDNGDSGDRGAG